MKWYLPDSSVAGSGYYQVDGAYDALFSADLAYQQIEGSVIGGRQQLRDVACGSAAAIMWHGISVARI